MKTTYYNNPIAKMILFSGYSTIMLFGFILTKLSELKPSTVRHENIHQRQYMECMVLALPVSLLLGWFVSWCFLLLIPVLYYILYVGEWLVRILIPGDAYWNISFEKEAYQNQNNIGYLNERKWMAWIRCY